MTQLQQNLKQQIISIQSVQLFAADNKKLLLNFIDSIANDAYTYHIKLLSSQIQQYWKLDGILQFCLMYTPQLKTRRMKINQQIKTYQLVFKTQIKNKWLKQKSQLFTFYEQDGKITINIDENASQIFKLAEPTQFIVAALTVRQTIQHIPTQQLLSFVSKLYNKYKIYASPASLYLIMIPYVLMNCQQNQSEKIKLRQTPQLQFYDSVQNLNEYTNIRKSYIIDIVQNQSMFPFSLQKSSADIKSIQTNVNQNAQKVIQNLQKIDNSDKVLNQIIQKTQQTDNFDKNINKVNQNQQLKQITKTIRQKVVGSQTMKQQKTASLDIFQLAKTEYVFNQNKNSLFKLNAVDRLLNQIDTPEMVALLQNNKVFIQKQKNKNIKTKMSTQLQSALNLYSSYLKGLSVNTVLIPPDITIFPSSISTQIMIIDRRRDIQKSKLITYIIQMKLYINKLRFVKNLKQQRLQSILNTSMPYILQKSFQIMQKPLDEIQILIVKGHQMTENIQKMDTIQMGIQNLNTNQQKILKFISSQNKQRDQFYQKNFTQSFNQIRTIQQNLNQNKVSISNLGSKIQSMLAQTMDLINNQSIKRNDSILKKFTQQSKLIQTYINQDGQATRNLVQQNIKISVQLINKVNLVMKEITFIRNDINDLKNQVQASYKISEVIGYNIAELVQAIRNDTFKKQLQRNTAKNEQVNQLLTSNNKNINLLNSMQMIINNRMNDIQQIKTISDDKNNQLIEIMKKQLPDHIYRNFLQILNSGMSQLSPHRQQILKQIQKIIDQNTNKTTNLNSSYRQLIDIQQKRIKKLNQIETVIKKHSQSIGKAMPALNNFQKINLVGVVNSSKLKFQRGIDQIYKDFETKIGKKQLQFGKSKLLNNFYQQSNKSAQKLKNISQKLSQSIVFLQKTNDGKKVIQLIPQLTNLLIKSVKQFDTVNSKNGDIFSQLQSIKKGIQNINENDLLFKNSGGGGGDNDKNTQQVNQLKQKISQKQKIIQLMKRGFIKLSQLSYKFINRQANYNLGFLNEMSIRNKITKKQTQAVLTDIRGRYQKNTKNFQKLIFGSLNKVFQDQQTRIYTQHISENMVKQKLDRTAFDKIKKRLKLTYDF